MAQHHNLLLARPEVLGFKRASQRRCNTEELKQSLTEPQTDNRFGSLTVGQDAAPCLSRRHALETLALSPPVEKIGRGHRASPVVKQCNDALWLVISQRLQ